ncbi:hypothetical protein HMN09_01073300 [Mycena chlorophos]|uniref:Uncharacterized protein n=1 Tax=Mycena chlorophos TaxID=658473 RepID=A0A8H6SF20_MYCCL|nr:hypothetical protein HMN09_01073300 [Mycena chlorophos]
MDTHNFFAGDESDHEDDELSDYAPALGPSRAQSPAQGEQRRQSRPPSRARRSRPPTRASSPEQFVPLSRHIRLERQVAGISEKLDQVLEHVKSSGTSPPRGGTGTGRDQQPPSADPAAATSPADARASRRKPPWKITLAQAIRHLLEKLCPADRLVLQTVDDGDHFYYQTTGVKRTTLQDHRLAIMFAGRIRNVRKVAKRQARESPADTAKRLSKTRVRTRMHTTLNRRLETAKSNPLLAHHVPLLQQLGVDGTSSDESDREDPSGPRYYRHTLPFLSDECVAWKHKFDTVATTQAPAAEVPRRGNHTRVRRAKAVPSPSRRNGWLPNLPHNAYKPEWLAANPVRASRLREDVVYDFSFPEQYGL